MYQHRDRQKVVVAIRAKPSCEGGPLRVQHRCRTLTLRRGGILRLRRARVRGQRLPAQRASRLRPQPLLHAACVEDVALLGASSPRDQLPDREVLQADRALRGQVGGPLGSRGLRELPAAEGGALLLSLLSLLGSPLHRTQLEEAIPDAAVNNLPYDGAVPRDAALQLCLGPALLGLAIGAADRDAAAVVGVDEHPPAGAGRPAEFPLATPLAVHAEHHQPRPHAAEGRVLVAPEVGRRAAAHGQRAARGAGHGLEARGRGSSCAELASWLLIIVCTRRSAGWQWHAHCLVICRQWRHHLDAKVLHPPADFSRAPSWVRSLGLRGCLRCA
mmetsp:Transcript_131894/g.328886  ORF Transcript_131894/g.328886 Transcript_131894/m.328886 type:complete len:330 (+) Transcript_131894:181-1170(+)